MERISEALLKGIKGINSVVLAMLFLFQLIFTSYISYQDEHVSLETDALWYLLPAVLLLAVLGLIARKSTAVAEWPLFLTGSVIWLAAGIVLVLCSDGVLRFDPVDCWQTALEMNAGDFSELEKDGYLYYCPHQLGFITYERILQALGGSTRTVLVCNFLWIIGIQFLLWRLSDTLTDGDHEVNVMTMLLGFLFLPLFFYGMFAYGMIPGLFFLLLAYVCAARYRRAGGWGWAAGMAATCVISFLLKENDLIGVIAIAIWGALEGCRGRRIKAVIVSLLLVPCCLLGLRALQLGYYLESGDRVNAGIPRTFYIGMGININNEDVGPGWYDGTVKKYYLDCDQDQRTATELAQRNLGIYLQQMADEPVRAVKFFLRKTVSMWCDPLFESVWSGPLEVYDQHIDTPLLQSLYGGGTADQACRGLMKAYLLVLLGLCGVGGIRKGWIPEGAGMLLLCTTGGFLFHLFWEAKSQYAFPYICMLLPAAGCALVSLGRLAAGRHGGETLELRTGEEQSA